MCLLIKSACPIVIDPIIRPVMQQTKHEKEGSYEAENNEKSIKKEHKSNNRYYDPK
jgi:hypothetical protein